MIQMRRKRKSLTEAHSYRLTEQVGNLYPSGRYKNAFKACTALLKPTVTEDRRRCVTSKKGPISVQKAVNRINDQILSSLNYSKLTKSTIHNAIQWGEFSVSPLKKGRPRIIPLKLSHGLACHAVMMHSSGEGEASSIKMRVIADTLTLGTQHENKFSIDYLWHQFRIQHPKIIMRQKQLTTRTDALIGSSTNVLRTGTKRRRNFSSAVGWLPRSRGY